MDAAAKAAAPAVPSPLYKPLHELTEDDIAQVTREDCRCFLKEKGMRRPSWNKSQAIQQVISLKALLEAKPNDVDDDGDLTAPSPKRRDAPSVRTSPLGTSAPPPSPPPAPPPPPEAGGVRSRLPPVPETAAGPQMTIFYGGAVNVYDTVPLEKAVTIMKVAATRDPSPDFALQMPAQENRPIAPRPPTSHLPPPPPHVPCSEGPAGRRASLQRYLEKRKDRKIFKCKRGIDGLAPSDFEPFLSQKAKPNPPFWQQYPHDTISFTHSLPASTPTGNYFIENQGQTVRLSIDLNDDVQEV